MLDAAVKALSQMFSPPFRAVLLEIRRARSRADRDYRHRSSALAGLARHLWHGLGRGPARHQRTYAALDPGLGRFHRGEPRHHCRIDLPDAGSDRSGRNFFVDDIALEVERTYYPARPARQSTAAVARRARRCTDGFVLDPGLSRRGAVPARRRLGLRHLFLATAYLLGREYFELAAMRHRARGGSQAFAQDAQRHGLCGRHVHRRLRVDTDRQSRRTIVRHGVHGAHVQANDGRSATAHAISDDREAAPAPLVSPFTWFAQLRHGDANGAVSLGDHA